MTNFKKNQLQYALGLIILLFGFSCSRKDLDTQLHTPSGEEQTLLPSLSLHDQEIYTKQKEFVEILSKAVSSDPDLRVFLKNEALKMFDKDYEVFYPIVKNEIISSGQTFRETLLKYASYGEQLNEIELALPLLTIIVPSLPSGFSAKNWNTESEIPYVVSSISLNDSISFYDNGKKYFSIKKDKIPGFPVLAVKQNERIKVDNAGVKTKGSIASENGLLYSFISEEFDGSVTKQKDETDVFLKSTTRDKEISYYDTTLRNAFDEMGNSSEYWQRDYIYYGMKKTSSKGSLNVRFKENIEYMRLKPNAFYTVSDQDVNFSYMGSSNVMVKKPQWIDGFFEFEIDALINGSNGGGTPLIKYFSATPEQLFDITYEEQVIAPKVSLYKIKSIYGVSHYLGISLLTWDLQTYSAMWQFVVKEVDDNQVITETRAVASDKAVNFGIDLDLGISKVVKLGLKFGAEGKKTTTNTYSIQTTKGADELGTLELNFSDPVFVNVLRGKPRFDDGRLRPQVKHYAQVFGIDNSYVELFVLPKPEY